MCVRARGRVCENQLVCGYTDSTGERIPRGKYPSSEGRAGQANHLHPPLRMVPLHCQLLIRHQYTVTLVLAGLPGREVSCRSLLTTRVIRLCVARLEKLVDISRVYT